MKNETIVITGCNGHLGRQTTKEFVQAGYNVVGLDVTPLQSPCSDFEFRKVDLEREGLEDILRNADGLVHLAGLPTPHLDTQLNTYLRNTAINARVFHSLIECGVPRVIYASSQSVLGYAYAPTPKVPLYVPINEEHPTANQEMYGLSKLMGEELLQSLWLSHGLVSASLRFPVIWRPDNYRASIAKRVRDAERSPKSMWAYIDLRDAARACRLAFEGALEKAEIVNITSRSPFVSGDIRPHVQKWYGDVKGADTLEEDTPIYDAAKAAELFGFQSEFCWSEDGITRHDDFDEASTA